ncbi:ROK family protein [Prosthecobacter sp. SYSU 5D2]|uniref:ROK family transcriptional regulator n=1 Tax=Prosthecobacter sp. SYSU 5D2 TaxID=3134134 RepID=UPI0031FEDCC8
MRTKPADQSSLLATILLQLRGQHATSRSTLAKVTHLSPSTVGIYVDHLIALGYVIEGGLEQGKMGRPQRRLSLVQNAGWFAGVEFNAERIQAVRVDFAGKKDLSIHRPLPPEANTRMVLDEIKQAVVELSQSAPGKLLSMGVGVPGLVNPTTGVAMLYSFIPDWRDVPLVADLRQDFPVHVTMENNLRAVALAERWFGGGREMDDYVILGPRRGLGIAIMKNGQLVHGSHLAAGEIGRWPWPLSGNEKELHDVLTAPAVWRRLSGAGPQAPLPPDLWSTLQLYAGSTGPEWKKVIADYARVMSLLHLILDSKAYFLHGPLTVLGERFCQEITQQVLQLTPVLRGMPPEILPSTLGDEAGALGAASLAMEAWTPESGTIR